jgi:alpha-D-ribose 1-methylphosphonate 5-triphosphate diphosphatase
MSAELILTNARVVAPDAVLEGGTVVVRGGTIAAVEPGRSAAPGAVDLGGDWLLPGLVELHTDNLERQFTPRPGVRWPADAAMLAHDAQVAAAGITTVCDAVCVGQYGDKVERRDLLAASLETLRRARTADALKADHLLHLRLEIADPDVVELFEPLRHEPQLVLVSFMDHTPGQRQWRDLATYRTFLAGGVRDEAEFQALLERRVGEQRANAARHKAALLELLEGMPAVRASHDDTTAEHVAEAGAIGATISEFPTTAEAARAARAAGMGVVMGAPNLVIGGSHSGNVAAAELAREGLLDALSSDYVPASLLAAAFLLAGPGLDLPVPEAVATVTRNPADLLGLADRGRLAAGARADLVRVRGVGTAPTAMAVWREGARVA